MRCWLNENTKKELTQGGLWYYNPGIITQGNLEVSGELMCMRAQGREKWLIVSGFRFQLL